MRNKYAGIYPTRRKPPTPTCVRVKEYSTVFHGFIAAETLLLRRSCESAAEIHDFGIELSLGKDAKRVGFSVEQQTIEVLGLCPSCSSD